MTSPNVDFCRSNNSDGKCSKKNFNVIFVISRVIASFWRVFIKFRWHDKKLTQGCFSGSTNCDNPTTSTPTPITTSEVPNVCNDIDYQILFDSTRNIKHVSDSNFGLCDNFDSPYPSTDWKGPGWYRLIFMRANYNFVKYLNQNMAWYCFLKSF